MTTHADLDPAVLTVDVLECFGYRLSEAEAPPEAWDTWAIHNHPVLRRIYTLAGRGIILDHRTYDSYRAGTALAQTVTSDEARSLAEHFAGVWRLPWVRPALTPAGVGQITPGGVLGYLYGVEITVADPVRVVAEARGDEGATFLALVEKLPLPLGACLDTRVTARELAPEDYAPDRLRRIRQSVDEKLGGPHILVDLPLEGPASEVIQRVREHAPDAPAGMDDPAGPAVLEGYRALFGVALRAVPGATPYIVIRPAQSLTDAGAWVRGDWDGQWIEQTDPACEVLPMPIVHEAVQHSDPAPDASGARAPSTHHMMRAGAGFARPTGRIEVRQDGTVAEVYEVTAS